MTENTNKLDGILGHGEARARGQDLERFIKDRYSYYAKYISYDDMLHLWDMESDRQQSYYPINQRIANRERQAAIFEKIDVDAVILEQNRNIQRLKEQAAKQRKHASHELGAREFTLTYSPKWFADDEARVEMKKAMNKLVKYYDGEIYKLRAIGEVGTNGLSHIHCFYQLHGGLKITDKNFKRAWKFWNPAKKLGWGFEGGHHANVKAASDFLGYIEKDVETAWFDMNVPIVQDPN